VTTLDHDPRPPFEVVASQELARDGNIAFRRDRIRWPDGTEAGYRVIEAPNSAFMVPVHQDGTTVLVRQWRHTWGSTAWEVPAGTLEPGEDPLAGAQRELEEEAGLLAQRWTSLGVTHGTALATGSQHLYLARDLSRVHRAPEAYERDMILRELPLREAVDAALRGEIEHAGSVTALTRAARALGLL
jgi:ADP-ribose pyrophosphatase